MDSLVTKLATKGVDTESLWPSIENELNRSPTHFTKGLDSLFALLESYPLYIPTMNRIVSNVVPKIVRSNERQIFTYLRVKIDEHAKAGSSEICAFLVETTKHFIAQAPIWCSLHSISYFAINPYQNVLCFGAFSELGSGTFSKVFGGIIVQGCKHVAVKYLKTENHSDAHQKTRIKREISIMEYLNKMHPTHPNILRFYGYCEDVPNINPAFCMALVSELCAGGNLQSIINSAKGEGFPEPRVKKITQGLALALHTLRSEGIYHRDLKPDNILLSEFDIPKIADFGLSRHLAGDELSRSVVQTPLFMAPEMAGLVAVGEGRTPVQQHKIDLWSVGIIMVLLATGRNPVHTRGLTMDKLLRLLIKTRVSAGDTSRFSASFTELCNSLLERDPNRRISWSDFFEHSWLDLPRAVIDASPLEARLARFKEMEDSHREELKAKETELEKIRTAAIYAREYLNEKQRKIEQLEKLVQALKKRD